MIEKFIRDCQKFCNGTFRYSELVKFLDTKKDFLLDKNILENTQENEYNALWDTMGDIEQKFTMFKDPDFVCQATISVLRLYNYNLKIRTK